MGRIKIDKRTGKVTRLPQSQKSTGAYYNQYAGSSLRTGQQEERNNNIEWNRYAGSSLRTGQQNEPSNQKKKEPIWNRYAGSSLRIGQEDKSKASPSLGSVKAPAKQKATTYTIKKGDTLGAIAKRYGVDWRALAKANGIDNPNLIYAGVKLRIDPATMGKKNRRKVAISRPPSMRTGEKNFEAPTMKETLPMDYGALNIDIPERP